MDPDFRGGLGAGCQVHPDAENSLVFGACVDFPVSAHAVHLSRKRQRPSVSHVTGDLSSDPRWTTDPPSQCKVLLRYLIGDLSPCFEHMGR